MEFLKRNFKVLVMLKAYSLNKLPLLILGVVFFIFISVKHADAQTSTQAQKGKPPPAKEKPKMIYLGEFDAGHPGASIYKLFDPSDEVLCYLLAPIQMSRKEVQNGISTFEGNSVGSISCVKVVIKR